MKTNWFYVYLIIEQYKKTDNWKNNAKHDDKPCFSEMFRQQLFSLI